MNNAKNLSTANAEVHRTPAGTYDRTAVQKYLSQIGRRGGQKSRRTLTKQQSTAMTAAREKKKKDLQK